MSLCSKIYLTAYSKAIPSGAKVFDLKSIGGKNVVENQLCEPNSFLEGSISAGLVFTKVNDYTISIKGTLTKITNTSIFRADKFIKIVKDHKYYMYINSKFDYSVFNDSQYRIRYASDTTTTKLPANKLHSYLLVANKTDNVQIGFRIEAVDTYIDDEITCMCIDLTTMFGAGNEPTLEQCQQIFTEYIPYTEPTIKSIACNEVVVKGKNFLDVEHIKDFSNWTFFWWSDN